MDIATILGTNKMPSHSLGRFPLSPDYPTMSMNEERMHKYQPSESSEDDFIDPSTPIEVIEKRAESTSFSSGEETGRDREEISLKPVLGKLEEDYGQGRLTGKSKGKNKESKHIRLGVNSRERRRMHDLNDALDELRSVIPYAHSPSVRKLSKIATMLLAKNYILMQANALEEMRRIINYMNQTQPPCFDTFSSSFTRLPHPGSHDKPHTITHPMYSPQIPSTSLGHRVTEGMKTS
ncbi:hypothetical protein SNE40_012394 [Patella caerulea]|uniref:BHLH domain-containing protein n=1 Tax=Patella caerulea TaxID=87958 RepID=A0AAN8JNT7_PATCE